jgi:hypothetical protein
MDTDQTVSEQAKAAKDSAESAVKSGAEWTKEKGHEVSENSTVQSAVSSIKSAASRVGEFASDTYESITSNPRVHEASEGAKNALESMDKKLSHGAASLYSGLSGSNSENQPNPPSE